MQGPTFREEPQVTVTQAARILGISHQAVSQAVERGILKAKGPWRHRRIPLSEVIAYGIRKGWDAETLMKRAKKELKEPIDWAMIATLVFSILGIVIFAELFKGKRGSQQREPQKAHV